MASTLLSRNGVGYHIDVWRSMRNCQQGANSAAILLMLFCNCLRTGLGNVPLNGSRLSSPLGNWIVQVINLGVETHSLLTIRSTVLVESLALDILVCITSCSVVPLILATPELHVTASVQLEKNALSASITTENQLLGQSCHESLDAVDAFTSLKSGDTSLSELHGAARSRAHLSMVRV